MLPERALHLRETNVLTSLRGRGQSVKLRTCPHRYTRCSGPTAARDYLVNPQSHARVQKQPASSRSDAYGAISARPEANSAAGGHRYLILAPATTSIVWKSSARVLGSAALLRSPRAL